jgi:hypothetical protein
MLAIRLGPPDRQVQFNDWCDAADTNVGAHPLRLLSGDAARLHTGIATTAAIVPTHYAAEERIAGILRRLGKPEAAKFVEGKLPTSKSIRSGDLGEILATEWIATQGGYQAPIKRLRWKDHRNMAMRGDDVIGIRQDPQTGGLRCSRPAKRIPVEQHYSVTECWLVRPLFQGSPNRW